MNETISRNIIRFVAAPVAAAGIMGGAALGFAALANASIPACTYTGSATQCQTPGNVQINAQPGNAALYAAQQQYPFFGYGYGGLPFHHRGGHR